MHEETVSKAAAHPAAGMQGVLENRKCRITAEDAAERIMTVRMQKIETEHDREEKRSAEMKRELTYNDIVHMNSEMYAQEIYYKFSYVNGETAAIWSLGNCACSGKEGLLHTYAEGYLKKKGLTVSWSEDGRSFSVRERVIRVTAAVIEKDGRIFATQRGYGDFKDGWEFPGGKIEAGETPEEALKREIREELDTEIRVGRRIDRVEYDYPEFHLSMDCFLCTILAGNLILKEHEASRWLSAEELDSVDWLPADQGLIIKLKKECFPVM